MDIYSSTTQVPETLKPCAVTIGKFDCLHLGHKKLLEELVNFSSLNDLTPAAITFDKNPNFLLRPEQAKLAILGKGQKRQGLELAGISVVLEAEFNKELASLSPEQFVKSYLVDGLGAKAIFVGSGFRFGNEGSGDCQLLRELGERYGFSIHEQEPLTIDDRVVSTTWVRELLDLGDVSKAAQLLGRFHQVRGNVEHGLKIGRKIGFPTANISRDAEGYLPVDGVYSGWLITATDRYPAAHSVGINETFQAVPRLVESHILDRNDLDLYDQEVTLEFVDFVRPAKKFDGVEPLVSQIRLDLEQVKEQLGLK